MKIVIVLNALKSGAHKYSDVMQQFVGEISTSFTPIFKRRFSCPYYMLIKANNYAYS